MATAPTLKTTNVTTSNQNQHSYNPNNTTRERGPPAGTYWAKTYGGNAYDNAFSVQNTSDGGYIVAGYTESSGTSYWNVSVLKLNSTGGVTWHKTYGSTGDNEAYAVQETSDGGYIVAGYTTSFGVGMGDVWVLKLNSTGGVTWQKTYGGTGLDMAYAVQETSDGGYIVAGMTTSFGAGGIDVWVLKLDSSGGVTWQKTYGGAGEDWAWSIQQTSDGGYIVGGWTTSYGAGMDDAWVLKLNSTGGVTWQKTYGGIYDDRVYSVQQTSDGGYIVAGYTDSSGDGQNDHIWVLKLNSTGGVTWQKTYGGSSSDEAYSVKQTSDGGYIVAGWTYSFGPGSINIWVLKLDPTGNVTWQKAYGGKNSNLGYSLAETLDGGYIVAGMTTSFGAGNQVVWVLKLEAGGKIVWDAPTGASTQTTYAIPKSYNFTTTDSTAKPGTYPMTVENTTITPVDSPTTVETQAPDLIPPATITDLATSNPTNTSVKLTWTAPGDDGMKGNATGYLVKYSTSGPINTSNLGSATNYTQSWTPAKSGTTETHAVTGLNPGTKYWFAVEAYDSSYNYAGISNSPSATTTTSGGAGGVGGGGGGAGGNGQGIPLSIIVSVGAITAAVVVIAAALLVKKKKPKHGHLRKQTSKSARIKSSQ
jgi:uncharacterized delta-60 repeat protein